MPNSPLMETIFNSQFLAISWATSLTSAGEKLTLSPGHLDTSLKEAVVLPGIHPVLAKTGNMENPPS